jgi:type I restriction enzyme S subunit
LAQGDLLIEKSGGGELQPVGNVVSFDDERPSVCSNFVARMPVAKDCESRFVAYVFRSLYEQGKNIPHIKQTSGIQNLDSESYLNEVAWLPEREMQLRIANFLDDKTARIDALIAEKERLLERLSELRYSTVSWAVTGGLHSNKGTFKTGHPFVPELPSGWQLGGLTKYIGPVVDYRGKTPEKVEEGVLLVTARNIRDGLLDYSASAEYVKEDAYEEIMRRGRPEVGDVLFTTEAPLGQVANVDRTDIALAQRVVKFRGLMGILNNYFLKYWLMGDAVQSTLTTLATGSTAEGIKASKLGQIPIAVPSIEEQAEVVAFLDERRKAFDAVSSHAQDHIARLREYRSSLISAAVTGQLDLGSFEAAKA